jgi:hypothetical protein
LSSAGLQRDERFTLDATGETFNVRITEAANFTLFGDLGAASVRRAYAAPSVIVGTSMSE